MDRNLKTKHRYKTTSNKSKSRGFIKNMDLRSKCLCRFNAINNRTSDTIQVLLNKLFNVKQLMLFSPKNLERSTEKTIDHNGLLISNNFIKTMKFSSKVYDNYHMGITFFERFLKNIDNNKKVKNKIKLKKESNYTYSTNNKNHSPNNNSKKLLFDDEEKEQNIFNLAYINDKSNIKEKLLNEQLLQEIENSRKIYNLNVGIFLDDLKEKKNINKECNNKKKSLCFLRSKSNKNKNRLRIKTHSPLNYNNSKQKAFDKINKFNNLRLFLKNEINKNIKENISNTCNNDDNIKTLHECLSCEKFKSIDNTKNVNNKNNNVSNKKRPKTAVSRTIKNKSISCESKNFKSPTSSENKNSYNNCFLSRPVSSYTSTFASNNMSKSTHKKFDSFSITSPKSRIIFKKKSNLYKDINNIVDSSNKIMKKFVIKNNFNSKDSQMLFKSKKIKYEKEENIIDVKKINEDFNFIDKTKEQFNTNEIEFNNPNEAYEKEDEEKVVNEEKILIENAKRVKTTMDNKCKKILDNVLSELLLKQRIMNDYYIDEAPYEKRIKKMKRNKEFKKLGQKEMLLLESLKKDKVLEMFNSEPEKMRQIINEIESKNEMKNLRDLKTRYRVLRELNIPKSESKKKTKLY